MNQAKKQAPTKSKTINYDEMQKKKLLALKERDKEKEQEIYGKLENSFKPLEQNEEFGRFFHVKSKLYETRLEREKTRSNILGVKGDFDELKTRLKGFIQDQVVSSAKIAVPKGPGKSKTVTA